MSSSLLMARILAILVFAGWALLGQRVVQICGYDPPSEYSGRLSDLFRKSESNSLFHVPTQDARVMHLEDISTGNTGYEEVKDV